MGDNESKVRDLPGLRQERERCRREGKRVVLCHGTFDLLHIGHIKHLQAARNFGDALFVTVTLDRFVNKGPHRPVFPQRLRIDAIAALECVDFVALNEWPTAVELINLIKPDFYVKGFVQTDGKRDYTDAILVEEEAVNASGGKFLLTEEETFSASHLINRYLDIFPEEVRTFLMRFRKRHSPGGVIERLQNIRPLRILAVGETIIDEYQFCNVLGKANKDPVLAAQRLRTERYAGGILAVANHLAGFCDRVGLLTMVGKEDESLAYVRSALATNVEAVILRKMDAPTIVKRRFLEDYKAVKLFEVYEMCNEQLTSEEEDSFCQNLMQTVSEYDVVIVADYGHGLITPRTTEVLGSCARFLAVSVQVNAGNRGINPVSKYPRADYISISENELLAEVRDNKSDSAAKIRELAERLRCPCVMVTRGNSGCMLYREGEGVVGAPAVAIRTVDRIGAGDAVLSLTAPCVAMKAPVEEVAFIANVVGSEACAVMGNKSPVDPGSLFRHIHSLLS